ncbi:hypothetical protein MMC18_001522 [Xylographa bjoerkii]|nr:hypothetical protein [Xylographa bjoerkii]
MPSITAEIDLERGEAQSIQPKIGPDNERLYQRILQSLKVKAQNSRDETGFFRLLAQIDGIGVSKEKESTEMGYLLPLVAVSGSMPMVEAVSTRCFDVNVRSPWKDNQTALYAACNTSPADISIVKYLLERGASPNSVQGSKGPPLHVASIVGNRELVKLLLEYGAPVDLEGEEYQFALQAAAFFGRTQTVELLLFAKANVNAVGTPYGTALMAALAGYNGPEVSTILLRDGADVSIVYNGRNVLETAANCYRPNNKQILPALMKEVQKQKAQGSLDDGLVRSYERLSADSKTPFIPPTSSSSVPYTPLSVHSGVPSIRGMKTRDDVIKKFTGLFSRKPHGRGHADQPIFVDDSGDESDASSNPDGREGREEDLPLPPPLVMPDHSPNQVPNVPNSHAENAEPQLGSRSHSQLVSSLSYDNVSASDQTAVIGEKQLRDPTQPPVKTQSGTVIEPAVSPEVISRLWSTAQLMSLTGKFYASNFQTLQIFSLLNLQHQLVELNDNFQTDVNIADPRKVFLARKLLKEYYQELRDWRSASTFPTATGAESNLITDFLASSLPNKAYHSLAETKRTLILDSNPPVDAVRRFLSYLCRAQPWATDPNETAREELRELLLKSNLQTPAAVLLSKDVDRNPQILPLVDFLARLVVAVAGAALLVVPMVALNYIAVEWGRILAVGLFVLAFALGLGALSRASNQELVAASATYGAVLVLYIGHVAGSG